MSQFEDDLADLDIRRNRPSITESLEEMKQCYIENKTSSNGVAVLTCGPIGFQHDVHDAVCAAQNSECRFALHKETFIL